MSTISSATTASATSPIADLFHHAHKKGGTVGSSSDASTTDSTQGPTSNQGLFSNLLDSIEQVMGISLTSPTSAASQPTSATSATSAGTGSTAAAAAGLAQAARALGANINVKA